MRGIANKTGAGAQIIASANGLVDPYVIHPGQSLKITGGRYHTVNSGETGIAIARAYGADAVRWFMLSDSPPERDLPWSEAGIEGCGRFVQRLWRLFWQFDATASGEDKELARRTHRTIAAVADKAGR